MNIKELLTVIDNNEYLNIVSEKGHWVYEGKTIFITSDLFERKVKLVDIDRNEFFIIVEDQQNEHMWRINYSIIYYDNNNCN